MLAFKDLEFHQFQEAESSTFTYLLADPQSREAIIIDPVFETVERDLQWIREGGYSLKWILDSHVHADHITGAWKIKEATGAQTAVSGAAGVQCVDRLLKDGDRLSFGRAEILARMTPGHTDSCMSFILPGAVFTGDTLLIKGCGRTDFQQGSSEKLWKSVHEILFRLPDETIVFPAHDYKGNLSSRIGIEKKFNPRLGGKKSMEEFVQIMSELKLDPPKKIQVSVPANLQCGRL